MKKLLFGSKRAKQLFSDFRAPNDIDYIVDTVNNKEEYSYRENPGIQYLYENRDELTASDLYTIKLSHCFWDIHWAKTMHDLLFFQNKSVKYDHRLFKLLYGGWVDKHGRKKAYLNKTNEEFFNDNVDRKINHDDLHYCLSYYGIPLFERIKVDLNKASVSEKLFYELSNEDKLKLCREEIYVVACERFLIPRNFKMPLIIAYKQAVRLLLTSMTKGWFPLYIALHWYQLNNPDRSIEDLEKRCGLLYGSL